MNLIVIGAGAWGTALAIGAARHTAGHQVTLWARNAQQVQEMQAARSNPRYLPDMAFPDGLQVSAAPLAQAVQGMDLVIIATPMSALRSTLQALAAAQVRVPVAWLCKGFEAVPAGHHGVGLMPHEVCAQVAPQLASGALSGPSFAQEVARGQPTLLVAASRHATVRQALLEAFHTGPLRLYANEDIVGVEVGGAVKNVMAIAAGLCDGLHLGLNARAALLTRGLAEMTRLGVALGAKPETFMGLSGLGDLMLTATGDLSRNRKVGLLLAQGLTLAQAVDSLGHVAEGVYSARTVVQRAQAVGVEMPIAATVVELLDGHITPQAAVQRLMARDPKHEGL
ncbi:NAD(P)H-dependent glycerol-3-phosphate dehydrogenase [Comamonas aquatica]|uniref:NAD(P)H-dependent glycerol-3-phosphate dehydrogenase n=1 Tax=Comamonas aquatica TaxID=225991 RepID=UPI0005A6C65D|nr:NAD(P)H-dependent glycerol-3-phosphate dehydrogenase [Comamonas aquatica]MDH0371882.1 NAD(P)-dependent glycerol-3-phosphate dehydrogenase [Comamonas aquatica]